MARNYAEEARELSGWLESNKDKADTPEYQQVALAHGTAQRMAGLMTEIAAQKQDPEFNPGQYAGIAAEYLMGVAKDFASAALIKGGSAAVGQVAGRIAGERVGGKTGGKIGERIGGGLGAGVGSVIHQKTVGGEVQPGELLTDIAAGAIQPRSLTGAGIVGTGLDIARQAIDTGKIDLKQASAAGAGMAAGAGAARRAAGGAITPEDAMMAARIKAFEDVRPYGVVINPAQLSTELKMSQRMAGTEATSAKAAHHNQAAWQKMVREQAELPTDGDLLLKPTTYKLGRGKNADKGTIDTKIEEVSAPYREIAALTEKVLEDEANLAKGQKTTLIRPGVTQEGIIAMREAKSTLDEIKSVRFARRDQAQKAAMGDPEARAKVQELIAREEALNAKLELAAIASGDETLVPRLRDARQKIAVLKVIDDATTTYGTVDPAVIAALRDAGAPITGNLERIALFHNAFPMDATEIRRAGPVQGAGVAMAYTGRSLLQKNPAGAAAAGIPVVSEALRDYMLSPRSQQRALTLPVTPNMENLQAAFMRQGGALGGISIGDREQAASNAIIRYMMNPEPMGIRR